MYTFQTITSKRLNHYLDNTLPDLYYQVILAIL